MGTSEEAKPSKAEAKSSSSAAEQANVPVYPDWAAMQAYYGPRVALPPYFNSAMASGHPPPHYMWAPPQHMMSPYGAPYAAIYSHGGVYAHPAVHLGSQPLGQGVPCAAAVSEAMVMAPAPSSIEMPPKSSGNADQGLMKKLKGFDGLAMTIGNGNTEGTAENKLSQSVDSDGYSDGSDGNTDEAEQNRRKRGRQGTPSAAVNGKMETEANRPPPDKVLGVPVASANATAKIVGTVLPSSLATTLELRNPGVNAKSNPVSVTTTAVVSSETWVQSERELKRERRKQSNRESARRSRLRKQAEAEELARKVESLTAENMALKSEINQLMATSEKLRSENASLTEKIVNTKAQHSGGVCSSNVGDESIAADSTENLLKRVNNSASSSISSEGADMYGNTLNSGAKLHQLLDSSTRADAVAAG